MSTTVGTGQMLANKTFHNNQNGRQYEGLLRGKSLNYDKKPTALLLIDKNQQEKKQFAKEQKQQVKDTKANVSKLAQQFLTFKLENPKIVTVKK